ncbi:hypothetical protein [Streptomyces sp. NBC_01190]|uniref:hypothetical protein n=1 Tax=Streptomyces sp. NBC_01190 TaxID=2903767 RepID=UPI0038657A0C|nr:hypothetical protein OG519_21785 [Streptomyces sp. NBC_01190]
MAVISLAALYVEEVRPLLVEQGEALVEVRRDPDNPGGLAAIIEADDLRVREVLYWSRLRVGVRHAATVLANGWLSFEAKP